MKKIIFQFLIVVFVITGIKSIVFAQKCETNEVLCKKVTLYIKDRSLQESLNILSGKANVPIGFVDIDTVEDLPKKITLTVKQATVENTLNELIKLDKRYIWKINDHVINILPVETDSQTLKISQTVLKSFEPDNTYLSDLGENILDTNEIRLLLNTLGKKKDTGIKYSGPELKNSKIKLKFVNQTVKEILNEILRKGYGKFWQIEIHGDNNEFVTILII